MEGLMSLLSASSSLFFIPSLHPQEIHVEYPKGEITLYTLVPFRASLPPIMSPFSDTHLNPPHLLSSFASQLYEYPPPPCSSSSSPIPPSLPHPSVVLSSLQFASLNPLMCESDEGEEGRRMSTKERMMEVEGGRGLPPSMQATSSLTFVSHSYMRVIWSTLAPSSPVSIQSRRREGGRRRRGGRERRS